MSEERCGGGGEGRIIFGGSAVFGGVTVFRGVTIFGRVAVRREKNVEFEGGEGGAAVWGAKGTGEEREGGGVEGDCAEGVAFDRELEGTRDRRVGV